MYLGDIAVLRWAFTDDEGRPVDLSSAAVDLDLYGPTRIQGRATILEAPTDGKVEFQLVPTIIKKVGDYQGRWVVAAGDGTITSVPGVVLRVLDPADQPWANLINLETIVGTITDPVRAAAALDSATRAVRAYIYTKPDPDLAIPDRIVVATAMLAASLYAGPEFGEGIVASESIGDYRVSYQYNTTLTGLSISGIPALVDLLAPWRPRLTSAYIGPGLTDTALPVTGESGTWISWLTDDTVTTITTEEVDVPLDMNPPTLDIVGVRAGDKNERTFTLNQGGAPIDLSGYALEAQARQSFADSAPTLTAEIEVIDAAAGQFSLSWPGDQVATAIGTASSWSGVWDLQATAEGELPVTLLQGSIECEPDVTR